MRSVRGDDGVNAERSRAEDMLSEVQGGIRNGQGVRPSREEAVRQLREDHREKRSARKARGVDVLSVMQERDSKPKA